MGLVVTHGAYNGSYSSFNDMRIFLITLLERERFINVSVLSKLLTARTWDTESILEGLDYKGLNIFLNHSDIDGSIRPSDAKDIAISIRKVLEDKKGNYDEKSIYVFLLLQFTKGCELASEKNETMYFR